MGTDMEIMNDKLIFRQFVPPLEDIFKKIYSHFSEFAIDIGYFIMSKTLL